MLGSEALAEEAAQEALLRLWTHAGSYEPEKAKSDDVADPDHGQYLPRPAEKAKRGSLAGEFRRRTAAQPGAEFMEGQVAAKVNEALQALPERQRLALILCHYEDMSMAEAAVVMETTAEAIESLLSRARRALRRQLEPEWRMLLTDDNAG